MSHVCNGGNIIVLNGTCGSGKTTIAELLKDKGWLAIDGDCAIQSLQHKKGSKQYEWNELIDETYQYYTRKMDKAFLRYLSFYG